MLQPFPILEVSIPKVRYSADYQLVEGDSGWHIHIVWGGWLWVHNENRNFKDKEQALVLGLLSNARKVSKFGCKLQNIFLAKRFALIENRSSSLGNV